MKTTMPLLIYRKVPLLAACVCAVALASSHEAQAVVDLAIGDAHELGTVVPGVPDGDHDVVQYANAMIGLPLGGSTVVTIGPHNDTVARSMNNFGTLPSPAFLFARGSVPHIDL